MSTTSQATTVERDLQIAIPIAIAKSGGVDPARRTVRGFMTQEVVDSHGEEVDFDSVVACLDTWRGNIREMHQPKAVGKAVDIVVRSDVRAVEVEAYVSKGAEDTWQKCLDGTLGFYSIGGTADRVFAPRSDGTRGPRLLMKKISELSLVDSGACPGSSISVVKMVDGAPVEQLEAEPASGATAKTADTPAVHVTLGGDEQGHALARGILKGLGFRSERWNIQNALACLALLEDLITDECFEDYGQENAPDNAAQVELLKLAVAIVLDFIGTEFAQQFAGDDLEKFGDLAGALAQAVAKAGARHSKGDLVMLQGMHDNCVKLGAACGVTKMDETTTPAPETVEAPAADPAPAVEPAPVADPAAADVATEKADAVVVPEPSAAPLDIAQINTAIAKALDAQREAFDTQFAELRATSDATIAKLQEQVAKLADTPAPGGPVANAHAVVVEKGSEQLTQILAQDGVAEQVVAKLEDLAKGETDPHQRQLLVEKALSLRLAHGMGAVKIPIPSQR